MAFSFLNPTNLYDRYTDAKDYTEKLTEPFPEFNRIARNRPHEGIDKNYPKTTDGTTASIIRKTPRRVVQQLPTGIVENDEEDWLSVVAGFVFTNKILPYANEEYDLIEKCWTAIEKGLTFGSCPLYTPFLNHDGYFCPDLTIPYWGDIFIQKGKKSGKASNYVFLRSWWEKEDVEALIDQEQKLAKSAKERGEKYESTWDIKNLKELLDSLTLKDEKARTPHEDERVTSPSGIELVIGFQKGIGAKFYTFSPSKKLIVRTKVNKDPRGKIPIDWLYGDTDGTNPLGRGIVELIGGLQNLIDSDMQMYQYNRALMLAPPIVTYGNINSSAVKLVPNQVIKVTDPNAKVEPLSIDTTAVANYPSLYGLQKSQLLNLVGSPDTSISSEVGNPGFGKTPQALKTQEASISVDDNAIRKMFEAAFENWGETAINIFFAERSGVEELQLDNDTAQKLLKLAEEGKFDPEMLSEDNKIMIDYDTATPALHFRVDASTSKMKNDGEQLEALQGLLQTFEGSQVLQQIVPQEKIVSTWNSIVSSSGVENPEDLIIDLEEFKEQQEQAQMMQQEQMAQEQMQAEQAPEEVPQEELPIEEPVEEMLPEEPVEEPAEPELDPLDEQFIGTLQSFGFGEQEIGQALAMVENGYNEDEILEYLSSPQEGLNA